MSTPTITISETSLRLLQELAAKTGQPMPDVLDKALAAYRRQMFFEQLDAGYAALRADAASWAEEQQERQRWDTTLMDGLEAGEQWTEDGRCLNAEEAD